jgi:hypothetical protein
MRVVRKTVRAPHQRRMMMSDEETRMTDEEVMRTMELLLRFWDEGGQEFCEALLKEEGDD